MWSNARLDCCPADASFWPVGGGPTIRSVAIAHPVCSLVDFLLCKGPIDAREILLNVSVGASFFPGERGLGVSFLAQRNGSFRR
jgi:hypothetical protein